MYIVQYYIPNRLKNSTLVQGYSSYLVIKTQNLKGKSQKVIFVLTEALENLKNIN